MPAFYFFEELPDNIREEMRAAINSDQSDFPAVDDQEVLKMVRTYYRITAPKLRSAVLDLCKHLGGGKP